MENIALQVNGSFQPFNSTSNETDASTLPDESIMTIISQSTLGTIGFFANLSVIVTLSSTKKLRNKFINMYIINQVRQPFFVFVFVFFCKFG